MNPLFPTSTLDLTSATCRAWTRQLTSVSLSGTLRRKAAVCSLWLHSAWGHYSISYSFCALIGVWSSDLAFLILVYK